MKLKSLELQGFKSFPDKTVLNFDRGITAIIGPNGSGKSNISDAVRWVLGETSARNIRGGKMEDVIFGGTELRRSMGYAEVTLTLDNSEENGKLNLDYDEVTISRRYYRNGDSDYMINRKPVRLRDIQELFMNTGLGRGGYSIVGQGKISDIVSRKSEDRRAVFEEAAGIAIYRQRKRESERRLADTQQNLLRIGDIVMELESRVGPLEKEAETAKKYLELYEEKKKLDIRVAIYDIDNVKNRFAEINDKYLIAKRDYETAEDEVNSISAQRDKISTDTEEKRSLLEDVDRRIAEKRESRLRTEGSAKVLENEFSHIGERIAALEEEKKRHAENKESISEALKIASEEYEKAIAATREMKDNHASLRASYDSYLPKIEEMTDKIDEADVEEKESTDALLDKRIRLSAMVGGEDISDELIGKAKEEEATARELFERLSAEKKESDKKLSDHNEKVENGKKEINEKTDFLSGLSESSESLREKTENIRAAVMGGEQKLSALRTMEEHFEGYAGAVRHIMNGSKPGVIGPISKLISVPSEYTVAVEIALGTNIQNIVTETDSVAKDCIAELKKAGAGRATFYPLSSLRPTRIKNEQDIRKETGFLGFGDEVCKYDPKYSAAVEFALARTAVFDNIDNASAAEKRNSFSFKAVTLDGQVINAGGSYTGGSSKKESGILSRAEEIKTLETELRDNKKEYEKVSAEYEKVKKQYEETAEEISALADTLSLLSTLQSAEQVKNDMLGDSLKEAETALENAQSNLRGFDEKKENRASEIAALRSEIESDQEKLKAITEKKISLGESLRALTAEQNKFSVDASELELKIIAADHDNTASADKIEALRQTLASEEEAYLNNEQSVFALSTKRSEINEKIEKELQRTGSFEEEEKALAEEREKFSADVAGAAEKLADADARYKDASAKRDTLFKTFTKYESQRNEFMGENDAVSERLYEEYELTYSDAVALNYEKLEESERNKAGRQQAHLRNQIRMLGNVNVGSIEEYAAVKERYDLLSEQTTDLEKAKKELISIISKLEAEMSQQFTAVFDEINVNFKDVFRELFGGGKAELRLEDPENPLECGIEILAAPPGKVIKSLLSLSGGEQTFVAIALLFAILRVNPTPFCLLDEIEAALDEINVTRFADYTKKYSDKTQFLIITHRRGTMESADMLYGVTMHEKGISEVLGVNMDDAERKLGVKLK